MAFTELLPNRSDVVVARIESAPFGENTYVFHRRGEPACLIVDPGFEPGAVVEWIEQHSLAPVAILLTHGHSDHIAGNGTLRGRWPDLPILIGRDDASKLTDPAGNLSGAFGLALVSPPADRLLEDGESLSLAGFTIGVVTIPGHSRGHVVFRIDDAAPRLVFGGDVLFQEGIGRTDFPDGDFAALESGIRRGLYTLPDDTVVYPGHGDPTTIGHERLHNPFVADGPSRGVAD
jgi:glyoxylase-like metal-dependent hydrolase (beta-lactamase superfamily II)